MFCECPIPLDESVAARRIYSPLAYAPVRDAPIVPIVHSEVFRLAAWYPVVWQRRESSNEFVVVRSFLDHGGEAASIRLSESQLPLLLQAYPFVFDPGSPPSPIANKMLDDVAPDSPTDIGAPITTVDQKLSYATELRIRTLDLFAQHYGVTQALSRALTSLDLFEPWELKFDINGKIVEIPDLLIVRQQAFDSGVFSGILAELDAPAASMLGLHRISLFRAGTLLAAARAVLLAVPEHEPVSEKQG